MQAVAGEEAGIQVQSFLDKCADETFVLAAED